MPQTDSREALKLLSAAPWFDTETAEQLLSLSNRTNESAPELLQRVRRAGLLVRHGDLERVQEPARSEWRQSLYADDAELYHAALSLFAQNARTGLAEQLPSVLGEEGSFLTARAIECVATPEPVEALDDLVGRVEDGPDGWDATTAVAVAHLIELYGFKRDRLSDFFRGLSLWSGSKRDEAATFFRRVVADRKQDRATAISEHLLGVAMYEMGDLLEAESMLADAIEDLESINDVKGLELTLCTYGRVQRTIYEKVGDQHSLAASRDALERALRLSVSPNARRCRTLQYLARTVGDYGEYPLATSFAEQAVQLAADPVAQVNSRTTLALILRGSGDDQRYLGVVEEAAQIATQAGVGGVTLARVLNMAAAARRRNRDWSGAEELAMHSINLGKKNGDRRHVAHAQHTLAAILIDRLVYGSDDPRLVERALDLTSDSRETLAELRDVRGVGLIDATVARLIARVAKDGMA